MGSRPPLRASTPGFGSLRSVVLALCHVIALSFSSVSGHPLPSSLPSSLPIIGALDYHDNVPEVEGLGAWGLYVASAVLVLLGGAFAGLTIALMGQDSIYLQVVAGDPNEPQNRNARRVYRLLQRGKHWVLVTLLLGNVIVNETLPVVLDRCLGGGVAAVIGSTILIVIFGEVVPQSICVRYGLPIGGYMSGPVLLLMYLMSPVAWPIAKLLDWVLGEDLGTVYKKSGLKTLVGLHQSLGEAHDRLNEDEVTIISAVLDLKSKKVGDVMTPMEDVFTMSEDTVLDEKTMDRILSEGYSRIPVHASGQPTNFVGMLLVKILITYDPEDGMLVKDFPLATLPETRPETSCLDIINFFQEGKSHMVLVSEFPGDNRGALGIVCLEDVIEELIGEEIIDESDVYIDVHKAIRRLAPAPKARTPRRDGMAHALHDVEGIARSERLASLGGVSDGPISSSPRTTTFLMRRASAGPDGHISTPVTLKAHLDDIRDTLRHLGPSNPATNPRNTRSTAVKIKPGLVAALGQIPHVVSNSVGDPLSRTQSVVSDTAVERMLEVPAENESHEANEDAPLLKPLLSGKNGAHAVRRYYGAGGRSATQTRLSGHYGTGEGLDDAHSPRPGSSSTVKPKTPEEKGNPSSLSQRGTDIPHNVDSPASKQSSRSSSPLTGPKHGFTEDLVESGGIRKIVIRSAGSDGTKDSNGYSPTSSATVPRHRTWSLIERFGGSNEHDRDRDDASRVSRTSTEPVTARSVGNVAELVENHLAREPIQPLIVVPDTSSPIEAPLAQAITEPIAEPLPEPVKPVEQSKEQQSKKQPQEPTPEPTPESTPEPTPGLETEPTPVPVPVPAPMLEPVQPPQRRAKSPTPPFGKAFSPFKHDPMSSPDLSLKSPTDGVLEEEDLTASTATLGAASNAGSSSNNHKRKNQKKKKKKGKGTTF